MKILLRCRSIVRSLRKQLGGNGGVGLAGGHQAQHLKLREGSGRGGRRDEDCPRWHRPERHQARPRVLRRQPAPRRIRVPAPSVSESARQARPINTRTRATSYGAAIACQVSRARRKGISPEAASPWDRRTAPRACAAMASGIPRPMPAAARSSSAQALSASSASPAARAISTCAGRSRARLRGSAVALSTRRIDAAAAALRPCASRNRARPGCGSQPKRLACR